MDRNYLQKAVFFFGVNVARKWEVLFNRAYPDDDLTLKQMMVMILINQHKEKPLTIKGAASALGTSHQNVKALAVQLEKKGFIRVDKAKNDRRVSHLVMLEENTEYWAKRNKTDDIILDGFFEGVTEEELVVTMKTIMTLNETADNELAK